MAVDDASRVAYAARLPDETAASAVAFLQQALAWLATVGLQVAGLMTDNAFCYTQRTYSTALRTLHLRHLRTRPYTPRPNGKAERFIQTAPREWAYAKPYRSSRQRAGALGPCLTPDNTTRPHTAHGRRPPISRLSARTTCPVATARSQPRCTAPVLPRRAPMALFRSDPTRDTARGGPTSDDRDWGRDPAIRLLNQEELVAVVE